MALPRRKLPLREIAPAEECRATSIKKYLNAGTIGAAVYDTKRQSKLDPFVEKLFRLVEDGGGQRRASSGAR